MEERKASKSLLISGRRKWQASIDGMIVNLENEDQEKRQKKEG